MEKKSKKHFIVVHSGCHGAWSWYKVKTLLEAAGHCVSAIDLAASGVNTTRVEEIQTLKDYSKPLLEMMDSLASEEKVILVAHSMGGIPSALAADTFPFKTSAIVFLTSSMPDTKNPPAYVFEKMVASIPPEEFLDTVFGSYGTCDHPLQTILFGPKFLAEKFYQLSPVEDLELAKMLVRVNPLVTNNLAGTTSFTEKGYGSIPCIYIICEEENIIPKEYQHWVIRNFPPKEVIKIKDADHMPMNRDVNHGPRPLACPVKNCRGTGLGRHFTDPQISGIYGTGLCGTGSFAGRDDAGLRDYKDPHFFLFQFLFYLKKKE